MSDATTFRFTGHAEYAEVVLLPALNDAPWSRIEEVGNEVLEHIKDTASPRLIVDLTELNYMGSAMVALLVRLWKAVSSKEGRMVVVNRHEMVFEVLKLAGLTKIWTIVDSTEAAAEALELPSRQPFPWATVFVIVGGIAAVIAAAVGLYLQLRPIESLAAEVAYLISLGSAAFGLIVGLFGAMRLKGAGRVVGFIVWLISLGIGAVAAVQR